MIDLPEMPFADTVMTTIVFYGFDRKLPAKEAKALIENICGLLGETPSHTHVGLDEEGRRSRAPKWNMLDKAIAMGDFDGYSYIEAVNYFEDGNVRDLSFSVGVHELLAGRRVSIRYKRERAQPFDLIAILYNILSYISPQYGILYNLLVREGPAWFETGIISSGMSDVLGQLSGQFKHEYLFGKKFADGFFRDVFKWNYLSRAHLDKTIEGMRFEDWIEESQTKKGWLGKVKTRGTLSLLGNGSAVWELTMDEATEVRPRMLKAGLLMVKS